MFEQGAKPLFVFEMANNHMGDLTHGLEIIRTFGKISFAYDFRFAFKFQYRDLNTFIHPHYIGRDDMKYVKRFLETRLSWEDFKKMREELDKFNFIPICTPFDENSVDKIVEHNFSIIKVASCSFTDWPLLEKIALVNKPIMLSTAGANLKDIDRVVSFFEHRGKEICLMHCVGEYPTPLNNLNLNQLDFFKQRYSVAAIGYSTHESPQNIDAIKIAIAKGARVFERHVGIRTEKYTLNSYSSSPEEIIAWLNAAKDAYLMCGMSGKRYTPSEKERNDLIGLKRGVFAKNDLQKGKKLIKEDVFFAIPNFPGQLLANDMSKYIEYTIQKEIRKGEPILLENVEVRDLREKVIKIVNAVKKMLHDAKISLPEKSDVDISHHYGIDKFEEYGATIINCINREYCKKLIVLLPKQKHPTHYHVKKEETFHVLYGSIILEINGLEKEYKAGALVVIERNVKHSFRTIEGGILEEISTTNYDGDSFYEDKNISANKNRKTGITFYSNWYVKSVEEEGV